MPQELDLKGRVCLVTGGAGMLGRSIVSQLLEKGKCRQFIIPGLSMAHGLLAICSTVSFAKPKLRRVKFRQH